MTSLAQTWSVRGQFFYYLTRHSLTGFVQLILVDTT